MEIVLFNAGVYVVVLLFCVVMLIGLAVLLQVEQVKREWLIPAISILIPLTIALATVFSGRNVSLLADYMAGATTGTGGNAMMLRLATTTIVGMAIVRLLASLFRNDQQGMPGGALFAGFLVFYVTNSVINAVFGSYPAFEHGHHYAVLAVAAIYVSRRHGYDLSLQMAKYAALGFLFLSCLVALIKPELAIQRAYVGIIPGLSIRFWGLGSNPNSIGPLALAAGLLTLYRPHKWLLAQLAMLGLCAAVLLVSQSKTAWLSAIVCLLIMWFYHGGKQAGHDNFGRITLLIIGSSLLVSLLLFIAMRVDVTAKLSNFLDSDTGNSLVTLTGRTRIWAVAMDAWRDNPLFGYGVTMWDQFHRDRVGLPWATSAHNQFLQSLGSAGLVGLLGLLVYLEILRRYAMRAAWPSKGLSVALFANLLLRSISETPFQTATLLSADLFVQLLLIQVCLGMGAPTSVPEPGHRLRAPNMAMAG